MLDLTRFDVITFDCYGTLIDWEAGILAALAPLRAASAVNASDASLLNSYAMLESALQQDEYRRYRDVLRGVMRGLATRYSVPEERLNLDALADSLASWRPFPDTVEALQRLGAYYRLGIISNTDVDLFAGTAKQLNAEFNFLVTAEQVGAYKPSHRNFHHALDVIGVPRERWLHAAQSRFHDIAPARELGIACVWVNRDSGRPGPGATANSNAVPDLEVPDLKTLADLADEAFA
ncbi:MAG TPA: haloacid dehalogenase type II [Candidatus Krumholzibacteria bacterium]|nr:haloacid dehalogenase type II [Candidatus Krumholzibacteria bacterium]